MKNLKKFNDLVQEGFFDHDVFANFGNVIKDTMSSSVNTDTIENETELEGLPEPGGSFSDSPAGKGMPLDSNASLSAEQYDTYGSKVGISDKSDNAKLEQPSSGPVGNIVNSAYANLNTPTRGIPGTDRGNLGCGAGTALMFYRATGYSLAGGTKISLSTQTIYDELEAKSKEPMSSWKKIDNWRSDYKPGDIIITRRGGRPGHVGIVVNDGNIISNSSGGFAGDKMGQIEQNYTIKSWESVAKRNPSKTAIFRYQGPYKNNWS
jgi:cell wall-associated NlpC family hydrolase